MNRSTTQIRSCLVSYAAVLCLVTQCSSPRTTAENRTTFLPFPLFFRSVEQTNHESLYKKWRHFSREKQHASQSVGDAIAWESMDRAAPKKIVKSDSRCFTLLTTIDRIASFWWSFKLEIWNLEDTRSNASSSTAILIALPHRYKLGCDWRDWELRNWRVYLPENGRLSLIG